MDGKSKLWSTIFNPLDIGISDGDFPPRGIFPVKIQNSVSIDILHDVPDEAIEGQSFQTSP